MEKTTELKVLNTQATETNDIKDTNDLFDELEIERQKEEIQKAFGEKGLISIEVLRKPEGVNSPKEAEEFYQKNVEIKNYLILDTEKEYVIRLTMSKKGVLQSVDPDLLPGGDVYEVSESIQEILRENGFPVFNYKFPNKPEDENIEGENDVE